MPELPEVETVRRSLEKLVIGKIIQNIDIRYGRIIRTPINTDEFKILLEGQTITSVGRRGKYLLFYFEDVVLISHLRMEGKYIYSDEITDIEDKHVHIIFFFSDGSSLQYKDVRKFGTMDIVPFGHEGKFPALEKLGQEPLDLDFDRNYFIQQVKKKNIPIKQILLNQEIISGLGNIYVDDSLAMSKIHPLTHGSSLSNDEIEGLIDAIIEVLNKAIDKGGSSIRSFQSLYGRGSMQDHLIVYGRKGEPCIYCGTMIEKIKIGGRGTHFCPTCQIK